MRASVRTLLFEGFSAGIQKIGGTVDGDSLDGKLMVELVKTTGSEFKLEAALRSNGNLLLKGKHLDPDSKKTLVSLGFATETPEGMKAEFSYADGLLKVNGKAMDATVMTTVAAGMNDGINAFLVGKPLASMHVPVPAAEAPAGETAEELMPPAEAPAQEESTSHTHADRVIATDPGSTRRRHVCEPANPQSPAMLKFPFRTTSGLPSTPACASRMATPVISVSKRRNISSGRQPR